MGFGKCGRRGDRGMRVQAQRRPLQRQSFIGVARGLGEHAEARGVALAVELSRGRAVSRFLHPRRGGWSNSRRQPGVMTVHCRGLLLTRRLERDRLRRLDSAHSRGEAFDRLLDREPPAKWRFGLFRRMSVYMRAVRSAPRSDPANSHDFLPRASPRSARSAALLTGMVPATLPFRLAFMLRGSHEWTTGIGASGARNGGRPSYP